MLCYSFRTFLEIHTAQYSLDFGNVTYRNQYAIKNGCINEILHNKDVNSLVIDFYKTKDGMIQIELPEFLYDLRPRSEHVVLLDGKEITFEQLAPSALLINFTENTKTIEIIDFTSTSESDVTSLKIPNAERDAKLAAGYKLYPDVGWIHPDDLGNQQPIYMDNPNNSGELILDIDSMQQVMEVLDWCHRESSELGILDIGLSFKNEIHYIDNNTCEWESISWKTVTGSDELEEALCIGGRGIIKNENCERIGKYDLVTGMPIVENKEQCDMLEGDWDEEQKICDSKYGVQ